MFTFLKRPLYVLANKIRGFFSPRTNPEEKWIADFSSPENSHFDIKSETSHDAYLELSEKDSPRKKPGGALVLGLKKTNCIAWVDARQYFRDQVIEARFSLDSMGGYASAGIMFRIIEDNTYYLALVSSRGYFRLDVVRNNNPLALIGWTEISGFDDRNSEQNVIISMIVYGDHLIFLVNDCWTAEVKDDSISAGRLGFALASYEGPAPGGTVETPPKQTSYCCKARLEYLSVESHIGAVEELYQKWNDSRDITAENRLRLAETFAAMGSAHAALHQIHKIWEAARSMTATYTESRAGRELLLAAHMARLLGNYTEADEFIDACIEQGIDSSEGKAALSEKAKILLEAEKFDELKKFIQAHIAKKEDDPIFHALLGHAHWYLKEYAPAAAAYDRAFELDNENGAHAVNAGNACDALGKKQEALKRYLEGGRAFLGAGNYEELGELIPRLFSLGEKNWEVRALAGKWAFGIEDFERAEAELLLSEKIRRKRSRHPADPPDPAVSFLRGLLLVRKGRRLEAFRFLEEAVSLAPSYGLFRFRLAENRYLYSGNAEDKQVTQELEAALELMPDDGWLNNFAAQISLAKDDLNSAERYLEKAARTLGEIPAIRANRGALCYLQGSPDEAIKILDVEKRDDPQGLLANCAGNLLVRAGNLEKADVYYRRALSCAPDNLEYISNCVSCLIELGYFGQAEELLIQAQSGPEILELLSHTASKKGEYDRAESASLAALDMAPDHLPSLFSLGWIYCNTCRWDDLGTIIIRLDRMDLEGIDARRREELRQRLDEGGNQIIACAGCERKWKIKRKNDLIPQFKLHAMPPDEFPAGSCPDCGDTYCIGCAKKHIDESGRFICPGCKINLKLANDGLKKIIYNWAASALPKRKRGKKKS